MKMSNVVLMMHCIQVKSSHCQPAQTHWTYTDLNFCNAVVTSVSLSYFRYVSTFSQGSSVFYTTVYKGKGKAEHLYSALHGTNHFKALRHGSHSF